MTEILQESGKPLDLKEASKREELLGVLDRVIERAYASYSNRYTKNCERIQWGRLIANCVKAAADVLADADIEDLICRVERLERGEGRGQ